jgi:hypothetical protein
MQQGKVRGIWDTMLLLDGRLAMMVQSNYMTTGRQSLLYCLFLLTDPVRVDFPTNKPTRPS